MMHEVIKTNSTGDYDKMFNVIKIFCENLHTCFRKILLLRALIIKNLQQQFKAQSKEK